MALSSDDEVEGGGAAARAGVGLRLGLGKKKLTGGVHLSAAGKAASARWSEQASEA